MHITMRACTACSSPERSWEAPCCVLVSFVVVLWRTATTTFMLCPSCSNSWGCSFNQHLLTPTQQEQADPQESPYFDSLCRSFLLGVGAGALVETVHMVSKLVSTPDVAGVLLMDC